MKELPHLAVWITVITPLDAPSYLQPKIVMVGLSALTSQILEEIVPPPRHPLLLMRKLLVKESGGKASFQDLTQGRNQLEIKSRTLELNPIRGPHHLIILVLLPSKDF
uniref:Uncharacterized protein n=1 Tax=Cacopsylla melanoneura TaxID=428564 RepID=A0A8D8W0J4_9HEMI